MKKYVSLLLVGTAALTTAACGGDNDGPSSAGMTPPDLSDPVAFTSFSDVEADSSVEISGISQEFTYNSQIDSEGDEYLVTSLSDPSSVGDATFTGKYDGDSELVAIQLETENRDILFSVENGDAIEDLGDSFFSAVNAAETDVFFGADAFALNWDYQSFGTWITGLDSGSGSGGALSVGAATDGGDIPAPSPDAIATAVAFTGLLSGAYVKPDGQQLMVGADVNVNVDFADRTAALASSNSQAILGAEGVMAGDLFPGVNMSGTLSYAAGENQLSGTLATDNGRLSGDATARFYGPAAEEIGGIFTLTSDPSSVEGFVGGFGAVAP